MTNDYPQQSLDIILYTMLSTNVCEIDMNQIPLLPVLSITNTYNIAHIFFQIYRMSLISLNISLFVSFFLFSFF